MSAMLSKDDAKLIADGWSGIGYVVARISTRLAARCFLIAGKYYMKAYPSPYMVDDIVGPLATLIDMFANGEHDADALDADQGVP